MLTPVMANKLMCFDVLAKHSPENSKKHAALLSICLRNLRINFKSAEKKKYIYIYIFVDLFLVNTCTFSNGMYGVVIRYSTQKSDQSPSWTFICLILAEINVPHLPIAPHSYHHFLALRTFVKMNYQR